MKHFRISPFTSAQRQCYILQYSYLCLDFFFPGLSFQFVFLNYISKSDLVCFETELSAHALLKKIFVLIKLGSLTVLNILANWMSMFNRENNFKCSVLSRFYSTCGITEKKQLFITALFSFCFCETKRGPQGAS